MEPQKMRPDEQSAYDEALRRIDAFRHRTNPAGALNLSNLGLTSIPPEVGYLIQLKELDLSVNRITSLPSEIFRLTELTRLSLQRNRLTVLPSDIGRLSSIVRLNLCSNRLTILPAEIGRLSELMALDLQDNLIKDLPTEFKQLKNLKVLHLSRNQITEFPEAISSLLLIKELYLGGNKLSHLPDLAHLKSLAKMSLGRNYFKTFPIQACYLPAMADLSVNNNEISCLPPEINQLQSLTHLHLSDNQLTTLPSEIGNLKRLRLLSLHKNKLGNLPPEIRKLKSLERLYLHDNPGLELPGEVLGATWEEISKKKASAKPPKDILDYYFLTKPQSHKSLEDMKILLEDRKAPPLAAISQNTRLFKASPELKPLHPSKGPQESEPMLKIFISYAHANHKYMKDLETYLEILKNKKQVSWWFDGNIHPGSNWDNAIRNQLEEADIMIVLLSNAFFRSKYIQGVEMNKARQRLQKGYTKILPILLEPSQEFENHKWLSSLQTAPSKHGQLRPLTSFNPRVNGWNHVDKALREMILEVAARRL